MRYGKIHFLFIDRHDFRRHHLVTFKVVQYKLNPIVALEDKELTTMAYNFVSFAYSIGNFMHNDLLLSGEFVCADLLCFLNSPINRLGEGQADSFSAIRLYGIEWNAQYLQLCLLVSP